MPSCSINHSQKVGTCAKKQVESSGDMVQDAVNDNLPSVYEKGDGPIIGILSQETYLVAKYFSEEHDSYIAASYVKFLESSGARVIPVWIGQNKDYYRRVVNYTNGILFPGGGTYFNESGGYGEAAQTIYSLAVEANNKGRYYPVWGTCLGMQVLGFVAAGEDIRVDCSLKNKAIPLDFVEGFENSRLFKKAPEDIISILNKYNVTFNYHSYCLTREVLERNGILSDWKILSTNKDEYDFEFISSMESTQYPIYGVQFHPEKNQFEFGKKQIPHDDEAVKISHYFSDFFVDECRKSPGKFPNEAMEKEAFIYNYSPKYTGRANGSFEQIYVFDKEDFDKVQLT
ncbi:gamma-glutamyl hydrolase isoform X2 [Anoplophora glabripennis]|uniref:gamma-glutamyl hydrolase isoform X2 n=1 Tax=Anoplophora glabripennis TaxID=217634 RepID=UPI000873C0AD|nr:gamma-glutamyl hydrolase isoform X2 [Anoplophora glabripennis]